MTVLPSALECTSEQIYELLSKFIQQNASITIPYNDRSCLLIGLDEYEHPVYMHSTEDIIEIISSNYDLKMDVEMLYNRIHYIFHTI